MFTDYFDESDSESASVVGGLIAEVSQLNYFNTEWRALLDRENLQYFHMKEFAHSTGQFKTGWKNDEPRRREFISRVIGIISRRARISVGIVIDRAGYERARPMSSIFTEFYVNEYSAAGFLSLILATGWAEKQGVEEPMAYIFDDGNSKRSDFQRAFDLAKSAGPSAKAFYPGSSLTFADDKVVLPLQAADFIAYEVQKVYTDVLNNKRRFRASLQKLMGKIPNQWAIGTEDWLLKLATKQILCHDGTNEAAGNDRRTGSLQAFSECDEGGAGGATRRDPTTHRATPQRGREESEPAGAEEKGQVSPKW